jgi:hypothetical protein
VKKSGICVCKTCPHFVLAWLTGARTGGGVWQAAQWQAEPDSLHALTARPQGQDGGAGCSSGCRGRRGWWRYQEISLLVLFLNK